MEQRSEGRGYGQRSGGSRFGGNSRSRDSLRLLNWGLRKFDTIKIAKKGEVLINLNVWLGKKKKVEVVVDEDIYLTIPKRKKKIIMSLWKLKRFHLILRQ